jgi:flagellar biosynthetic protein FlhB
MADNDASREDRQLPASERKLQKAREEGRVARSRDLGHFFVVGSALMAALALGPGLARATIEMIGTSLRFDRAAALDGDRLPAYFAAQGGDALLAMLPLTGAVVAGVVLASVVPGGVVLSAKSLQPKPEKLSPISGLKRIFSVRGAVELLKLIVLAISLFAIAAWFVVSSLPEFAGLALRPLAQGVAGGAGLMGAGLGALMGVLLLVALLDVPFQWFRHRADLRMTRQELKQEHKESEGDPLLRGRMRARQREIASRRMLAAVPAADVIITNPTHYAVAIKYDEASMGAPRVVAKGADMMAARIRELAEQAGVPRLEAPPLARALYAHVEVDREIPAALYTAVAQVLAYVYQLRNWVPGRGEAPHAPDSVEIPAGMDPQQ